MEESIFKAGDRVEQMCLTCGEVRGHVVVSVAKRGNITRVGCPICNSRVPYKSGSIPRRSNTTSPPYDRTRRDRKGQTLMHSTFGEGEVTAIVEPQKVDVLFADRMRRLIHGHT
jgi:hypothetical protein